MYLDFYWICLYRPFDPQYYEDEFEDEEMLDEEGRTRLKLKVCTVHTIMKCESVCSCHFQLGDYVFSEIRFYSLLPQVENTIRWRVKRDEEGNETRESNARIVKWSDGRCVLCQAGFWGCYTVNRMCAVLSMLLNVQFLPQHVPPSGEWSVWCLQSSSPGRPQPPVYPTGYWTARTGCVQNQTHIQVTQ